MKGKNGEYEVLNPWADVEPQPLKGLSPRINDLAGKTIGLLNNVKTAARPILTVVEEKLKERYPSLQTKWYGGSGYATLHENLGREQDPLDPKFRDWIKGVDAVITAVGD